MQYPISKKEAIIENHFGTTVHDPYRWMENEEDPALKSWIDEQCALTRDFLDAIPKRSAIKERLSTLYNYEKYGMVRTIGEYIVFSKNTGLQNQYVYYIQKGMNGEASVLIDPNTLSEDGTVAITLNGSSNDHRYLSFLKAESGSDWQELFVIDLENRCVLEDTLKWMKFTLVSWQGNGFYYSRYDQPEKGKELSAKNENMKVYYHVLGTRQEEDTLIYMDQENPLRYHTLEVSKDEKHLILTTSEGTYGNRIMLCPSDRSEPFTVLFEGFANEFEYLGDGDNCLFFLTDQDALNKKIIKVSTDTLQVTDFIIESALNLQNAWKFGEKFVLIYLKDVVSKAYVYNESGDLESEVETPGIGMIYEFSSTKGSDEMYFTYGSFVSPLSLMIFNHKTQLITTFKASTLAYDASAFTTEQVFCKSKDGTQVPVFLTYKKDLIKNGENPALLYAYGGFNVTLPPAFNPANVYLIENGGIYAQANIRGGSEYGEGWHKEGMLLKKQNVFDDFIAVAETLIDRGYTSAKHLSIQGGSNGGLLMGAVVNQRPELFKCVFPQVGVMDMLRYHKFTIGWGWVVEYGNPEDAEHFANLIQYSPLHNVEEKAYPSIMVMTADHDDRVVPAHSFKYIAALQDKNTSSNPMLIRIDKNAGHGLGKSIEKIIEEQADKFAFMGV